MGRLMSNDDSKLKPNLGGSLWEPGFRIDP